MLHLALIGVGKWGQNYLRAVNSLQDCSIKYVCTNTQNSLNLLPAQFYKTTRVTDLLTKDDIDGFILASPTSTHFDIAKLLISHNKNILIEKPFTENYQQALELQKIWQMQQPKVMIGHIYLYSPAFREFRRLVMSRSNLLSLEFFGILSPVRSDCSVVMDWGPHAISTALNIINSEVIQVNASNQKQDLSNKYYDTCIFQMKFRNNVQLYANISWYGDQKMRKIVAHFPDGDITYDDTKTTEKIENTKPGEKEFPIYSSENPLEVELGEFLDAIRGKANILSNIIFGVEVMKILDKIANTSQATDSTPPF